MTEWESKQLELSRNLLVLFRATEREHGIVLPPITSESINDVTSLVRSEWQRRMSGQRL